MCTRALCHLRKERGEKVKDRREAGSFLEISSSFFKFLQFDVSNSLRFAIFLLHGRGRYGVASKARVQNRDNLSYVDDKSAKIFSRRLCFPYWEPETRLSNCHADIHLFLWKLHRLNSDPLVSCFNAIQILLPPLLLLLPLFNLPLILQSLKVLLLYH